MEPDKSVRNDTQEKHYMAYLQLALDRSPASQTTRHKLLSDLAEVAWREFDKRRAFEWKFNLALWSALGLFAGFSAQHSSEFTWFGKISAGLILCAIGVSYVCMWSYGLMLNNRLDMTAASFYWRHLEQELGEGFKGPFSHQFEYLQKRCEQFRVPKMSASDRGQGAVANSREQSMPYYSRVRVVFGSWSHSSQSAITLLLVLLGLVSLGVIPFRREAQSIATPWYQSLD